MSEHSTPEQRTEMPTARRMSMLRRQGTLHLSQEVVVVASLFTSFMMIYLLWSGILDSMKLVLIRSFKAIANPERLSMGDLTSGFYKVLLIAAPRVFLIVLVVAVVVTLATMLQTNWNIREKKIKFRWDLLKPMQGLKRIVSIQGLVSTAKALLKLCLILPIGFFALKAYAPKMVGLIHTDIPFLMGFAGSAIWHLFWKILYVLIALAIFDYFWSRYQWLRQNKMTKDEVKDEKKSIEGDEETRRRIMWKGINRVIQRIKTGVRQADVVITNPTHYAIALKYDRESMSAPTVVAKGRGHMAQRIKKIAKEYGIPCVERKPLARALYASVEVGSEIPYQLFKAVAEVLAYVYRLRGPHARNTQRPVRSER
ncbi:MAG: EscU/YscU/HrcU family type III secretion system export apparatus switch protein [Bdellovibrionales bacterium]|nr:EscU/YscU/HrcU family type III secretion system export apparatus switch protein [Bdellovibrionales bacterium]